MKRNVHQPKLNTENMPFCSVCGKEVQANWEVCPFCSHSLSQSTAPESQGGTVQKLELRLLKKSGFFTKVLTVAFADPHKGVKQNISFSTMSRTYTARLSDGTVVGKLPLKGMTIASGAEGMISLPGRQGGHSYNAVLMTGLNGPTGLTITDWDDGRKCMISF